MPKVDERITYGIKDQHGTLRQIPKAHRHKRVVSITRNPLSRYLSLYHFRWWVTHPPAEVDVIRSHYVHFPDLSFGEFYDMMHVYGRANRLRGRVLKADIGFQTLQFIQFYFENPDTVLERIDAAYVADELFRDDMPKKMSFLHQESLNAELKDFLLDVGFSDEELKIVDASEKVNVTKGMGDSADRHGNLLDVELIDSIVNRDQLIFRLFPDYLPIW